jgi:hypothetical protein
MGKHLEAMIKKREDPPIEKHQTDIIYCRTFNIINRDYHQY